MYCTNTPTTVFLWGQLNFAHVRGLPVTGVWKHIRLNTTGDMAVFWWRERHTQSHSTHNLLLFTINRYNTDPYAFTSTDPYVQ